MVLRKRWLFSIGNGAEIRPLEKGRKCPVINQNQFTFKRTMHVSLLDKIL